MRRGGGEAVVSMPAGLEERLKGRSEPGVVVRLLRRWGLHTSTRRNALAAALVCAALVLAACAALLSATGAPPAAVRAAAAAAPVARSPRPHKTVTAAATRPATARPAGEDLEAPHQAAATARAHGCDGLVAGWIEDQERKKKAREKLPVLDLLFFLHVPRTAGRTFNFCLLKYLFPVEDRCERAYDHLRLDPHNPECHFLGTHDDYSLVLEMEGRPTIITQFRDPVDRILSSYEFAAEVSARSLRGNSTSSAGARRLQQTDESARPLRRGHMKPVAQSEYDSHALPPPSPPPALEQRPPGRKRSRVSTRDVWPWSIVLPWMDTLMKERQDAGAERAWANSGHNPYEDHPVLVSLLHFLRSEQARENLHNGELFQVLGITNNTRADVEQAAKLRACAADGGRPAEALLEFAKERITLEWEVVTVKEQLRKSMELATLALNRSLDDPSYGPGKKESQTKLKDSYMACEAKNRDKMSVRAKRALAKLNWPDGVPFKFDRSMVAPGVVSEIKALNRLDTELHRHATALFEAAVARHEAAGGWVSLPDPAPPRPERERSGPSNN